MIKRVDLKLMPPYDYIDVRKHMKKLAEANKKIAIFEDKLYHSKVKPHIFLQNIGVQESLLSTKIEGTRTSVEEVLENNLKNDEKISSKKDINEVNNYFKAIIKGQDIVDERGLYTGSFKKLHSLIMDGEVRGQSSNAGEIRTVDNWLGEEGATIHTASYVPPSHIDIDFLLNNLDVYISNEDDYMDELIRLAIIHVQFESIHPFIDGNGRLGRVIIPLYLYFKKIIKEPNVFISKYMETNKYQYYSLLNNVRYKNEWDEWITFFLEALIKQMDDNIRILESIYSKYNEAMSLLVKKTENNKIIAILDVIFANPIMTVKKVSQITGLKEAFIRKYLNILVEEKFLFDNGRSRNKVYYNYYILDLMK